MSQRSAAKVLGAVGRLLVGAGVVILLFAAYQLWGTSLAESKAQDKLSDEFADRLAQLSPQSAAALIAANSTTDDGSAASTTSSPNAPVTVPSPTTATSALPQELVDLLYPERGEPVAHIVIPRIGVDKVVVEGVETDDLRKGPGHFPDTPLPGQRGNAAIAGHRTTYGAPFGDIDQLSPGDEIRVSTVLGEAVYRVAGTRIVTPDQVEVVGDYGDNRLTLSACHPKFSAAQRIIVWAMLEGDPSPTVAKPEDRRTVALTPATLPADAAATTAPSVASAPSATSISTATTNPNATTNPTVTTETTIEATSTTLAADANHLAGDKTAWPGAVGWGLGALLAAGCAWVVARRLDVLRGKRRVRRLAVYALSSPAVLFCLFFCFARVDRLLPAY